MSYTRTGIGYITSLTFHSFRVGWCGSGGLLHNVWFLLYRYGYALNTHTPHTLPRSSQPTPSSQPQDYEHGYQSTKRKLILPLKPELEAMVGRRHGVVLCAESVEASIAHISHRPFCLFSFFPFNPTLFSVVVIHIALEQ